MTDIDIDNALDKMTDQEIQQMLDEWEADDYLSSLAASETQIL